MWQKMRHKRVSDKYLQNEAVKQFSERHFTKYLFNTSKNQSSINAS